jgi:hypothetical protein
MNLSHLITAGIVIRKSSENLWNVLIHYFRRIDAEISVYFHIHHVEHIKNLHVTYSAPQTIKIDV